MKKLVSIVLALAMLFTLCACQDSGKTSSAGASSTRSEERRVGKECYS